jgi:hypothetical protein
VYCSGGIFIPLYPCPGPCAKAVPETLKNVDRAKAKTADRRNVFFMDVFLIYGCIMDSGKISKHLAHELISAMIVPHEKKRISICK